MIRHLLSLAAALAAGGAFAQSGVGPDDPAVEFLPPADLSITVDDGLDTVVPVGGQHDGHASATVGDHEHAGVDQGAHRGELRRSDTP